MKKKFASKCKNKILIKNLANNELNFCEMHLNIKYI